MGEPCSPSLLEFLTLEEMTTEVFSLERGIAEWA